ncbi:glycoside hydrolase family 3 N-terminal domain-containing protein [Phytohabitans kaempferiae]|uniref:beta-glucosidase n=1 Tax=Phytohabitans kaempferiae TaxID=1620943 RepID=A0ABV6LYD4_9ACTN
MSATPPTEDEEPNAPAHHRKVLRLDRHGRTMIAVTVACVCLAAATLVASALEIIGPAHNAGATAGAAVPPYQDSAQPVPARVADLLGRMTLEDKLGQLTQVDRAALTSPQDIAAYRIGSILSGGGSAPADNTPTGWADMYDGFQSAAQATPLGIPIIYGIDAVHGHNNVRGATIFPHNIGLGATRDAGLVRAVGRATAEEVAGTGIDWTFAPCLCVARNDRWGRTYESFGEQAEIPTAMTSIIGGLQGGNLGEPTSILATAKHYVGDGGTTGGRDQGNTEISEAELRAVHLPPFQAAIAQGVGSIMVSFSSWNGQKLHGHRQLLTDMLKGELGFTGIVVSDWAGIDQIDGQRGFTGAEIATAVNAGIDMVMVPTDYRQFLQLLRDEVDAGRIPLERIDDANRRILTKKFELGLFERRFTDRALTSTVGNQAHRDLARDAVRRSQVLLKNQGDVLPLAKAGGKIFVAGKSADDIGLQSGGWTISWQGSAGNITPGTTILQGIRNTVGTGATVTYNREGTGIDSSYRAAIAVVGETPYAEGQGDRTGAMGLDTADLQVLSRLRASGVPVIVVLVSGRPLDIAAQVDGWAALVASWLPGTEGQGVADVLFGDYNPTGKLPVTWMRSASQQPINAGDGKPALFAYGFGLSYPGGPTTPSPSPTRTPTAGPTTGGPTTPPVATTRPVPTTPTTRPPATTAAPTTPTAGAASCTFRYAVSNQWQNGFVAEVRVTAGPAPVNGWTVRFGFPGNQAITNSWNATVTQSGSQVSAVNQGWNASVPAGGSVTFGFQATYSGTNAAPTSATVNGTACAAG